MTGLQEVTGGYESGVIIFNENNAYVLNWSGVNGIPRLDPWGYKWLGLGEQFVIVKEDEEAPEDTVGVRVLPVDEIPAWVAEVAESGGKAETEEHKAEYEGIDKCYELPDDIYVVTFNGWN